MKIHHVTYDYEKQKKGVPMKILKFILYSLILTLTIYLLRKKVDWKELKSKLIKMWNDGKVSWSKFWEKDEKTEENVR